jgi:uncharacterized 2Fe-2S/4Fe-4S cluster protein (DUF4445 family)
MLNEIAFAKVSLKAPAEPILLSQALAEAGYPLDLTCGGNGICGRCRVHVGEKVVLACQTEISTACAVEVPQAALRQDEMAVESAFAPPVPRPACPRCRRIAVRQLAAREHAGTDDWSRILNADFPDADQVQPSLTALRNLPESTDAARDLLLTVLDREVVNINDIRQTPEPLIGAAVDVGTTTVAVMLLDLADARRLALEGKRNQQTVHGANVVSRIQFGSTPEGLQELQELIVGQTIGPLLDKALTAAGLAGKTVHRMAVGGNTVMIHLLLGLPPRGLGQMPFNAVTLSPPPCPGAALALPVECVECLPGAGAYFGGDVVGGAYAVGLDRPGPPEMLVDIGTNGEMILRVGNRLLAASTAAGPAFEGHGLSCGGPAVRGAVMRLRSRDNKFELQAFDRQIPTHLCGSAYVDFLAEGRKTGFLLEQGRFVKDFPFIESAATAANSSSTALRCRLGSNVWVDEADVSLLLQAKAAVLAGTEILLRAAGIAPSDLNALYVAGGFGRALDVANAQRIGLLPAIPKDKVHVVGNTSLAAAASVLLNGQALEDMTLLARRIELIELNLQPDFQDRYIEALFLPFV